MWDLNTGKLLSTLEGHTRGVSSVAISPDSTKIVSASDDNTIKVWEIQKGKYCSSYKFDSGIKYITFFNKRSIILILDLSKNLYFASLFQSAGKEVFGVKPPIIEE